MAIIGYRNGTGSEKNFSRKLVSFAGFLVLHPKKLSSGCHRLGAWSLSHTWRHGNEQRVKREGG
jgi:hypothetical protein